MMTNEKNRREFTRVGVQLQGKISWEELGDSQGQSRDVSMKGIYLACQNPPPIGAACQISLRLGELDCQLAIEVKGKVVRIDSKGIGVEFTEILGIDSFDHLRNLVLYNSSGHTEQIERELSTHSGIKRQD